MADAIQAVQYALTAPAIGAYPTLFVPRRFKDKQGREGKELNYSLNLLFLPGHADIEGLRAGMMEARDRAVAGGLFRADDAVGSWPFIQGAKMADDAKAEGKDREAFRPYLIMRTHTGEKYPPALGCVVNGRPTNVPRDASERAVFEKFFFGGMECYAEVGFKAFKVGTAAPSVTAYLQLVMANGKGETVPVFNAGERSAVGRYGNIVGHVSATDPTATPVNRALDAPPM